MTEQVIKSRFDLAELGGALSQRQPTKQSSHAGGSFFELMTGRLWLPIDCTLVKMSIIDGQLRRNFAARQAEP